MSSRLSERWRSCCAGTASRNRFANIGDDTDVIKGSIVREVVNLPSFDLADHAPEH